MRAEKFAKERENIAREVVKTERVYATILSHIVDVFLNPLKESNLIKDGVITEENRRKIFPGALATLAQVHKDFLHGLDARVKSWTPSSKIGDLFLTMIPYFKLYPVYVSDFENQMKALKDAKNNERFWEFIKGGFALLKDPSNDLPSLLITPVQRIPRYLMLVTQLRKYTWPTHDDYASIMSAAEQLGKIAEYVDQKAKDAENVQKMHHVQEVLLGKYDTLLDPQRRFVNQGLVFEVRGKELRMMGLFHFSDLVVWAKVKKIERKVEPKKGDKTAAKKKPEVVTELEYHYQSRVPLMNCSLSNAEDPSKTIHNCFYLRTPEKNYFISCTDAESKKQWMAELNESIQQVNVKAATLRKQVALVEEKKATMRQVREEEKRKPEDKKQPAAAAKPLVSGAVGAGATPGAAPAVNAPPPLQSGLSSGSIMPGAPKEASKDAGKDAAPAKPKRSGWLLKRVKEDKSATAVTAAAEDAPQSVEDTQSEEDDSADGRKKKVERVSGKGIFRGATSRGAATAKTSAEVATATVVLGKKGSDVAAAAPAAAAATGHPPAATAPVAAPQPTGPLAEVRKRTGGWLARGVRPPSAGQSKTTDRRSSATQVAAQVAEDTAETTMNLSPGKTPMGEPKTAPAAPELMTHAKKALRENEDGDRIRRNSRILNLDDLPTLDGKMGDAHMAELKAAFDRLGETPLAVAGDVSPGRRRSLSAPDLLLRSPVTSPGPPRESDDEDSEEASTPGTPLRVDPKRLQQRPGATPHKDDAMAAAEAAAEAKRFKRLKVLKRGSMSGMDLTKLGGAGARRSDLGALVKDMKLTKEAQPSKEPAVAVANPDGSRTPPRPGRKAPVLKGAAELAAGAAAPPVAAPVAEKPPQGGVFGSPTTEKPVLRKADSVVLEDSDEDEDPEANVSAVAAILKMGGLRDPAMGASTEFEPANDGDDLSSSDDVGEELMVQSQSHYDPMSGQHITIFAAGSALTSGDATPQLVKPGSGDSTPQAQLSSRSPDGSSPPAPPEKSAVMSPLLSPEPQRFPTPGSIEASPRPVIVVKRDEAEGNSSFVIAPVPDFVVEEGGEDMELVKRLETTPMMRALSTVQANATASTSTEPIDESDGDNQDQEEDSQEASFEP